MARRGLVADLRVGIARARKTQAIVRQAGVHVEQDGSTRTCDVLVAPISSPPESPDEVFAVFFEEPPRATEPAISPSSTRARTTRDYLQWKVDEHQRANEQLLLVNAEIISRNEELQGLYAEVQAAKEEIQTTNDELAALNEQTQAQLGAAEWARDHAKATVEAVPVPLVVLTETLEIASANRAFEEQYGARSGRGARASCRDSWTIPAPVCARGRARAEREFPGARSGVRAPTSREAVPVAVRALRADAGYGATDPTGHRRRHRAASRRGGAGAVAP